MQILNKRLLLDCIFSAALTLINKPIGCHTRMTVVIEPIHQMRETGSLKLEFVHFTLSSIDAIC